MQTLNPELFDTAYSSTLKSSFDNAVPIRHVVIDQFLGNDFALQLFHHFPDIQEMKTKYNGINEKKSEHSDFRQLSSEFEQFRQTLASSDFLSWLERITGITHLESINDRLGYGLHQGANNSFLDIHIDYNLHPIQKKQRRLNLIVFLNKEWETYWGGELELWDKDVKKCIQQIAPVFNRCVIFECSNISYHGYSRISVPEGITRKSYYQYFFTPATTGLAFHDTIFKPRPQETAIKKLATHSKDFAKNLSKKVLLKLGFKRLLR